MTALPPLSQTLVQARQAMELEAPRAAASVLEPYRDSNPDDPEYWLQLARANAELDEDFPARSAFDRALELAPKQAVIWIELAIFESRKRRGGAVVKRAKREGLPAALVQMIQGAASGTGPRAIGTGAATKAELQTLAQLGAKRDFAGIERLATAILKRGQGAVIWGMLGQARMDMGRGPQACDAFRRGLKLEPYANDLRLALVRALALGGETLEAVAEARRAAHTAPADADAQLIYVRTLEKANQHRKAVPIIDRILELQPDRDVVLRLAIEAATESGRPGDALALAERRAPDAPWTSRGPPNRSRPSGPRKAPRGPSASASGCRLRHRRSESFPCSFFHPAR